MKNQRWSSCVPRIVVDGLERLGRPLVLAQDTKRILGFGSGVGSPRSQDEVEDGGQDGTPGVSAT